MTGRSVSLLNSLTDELLCYDAEFIIPFLAPDFVIAPPRIVFGAIAVRLKILALFYIPFSDGVSDENNP